MGYELHIANWTESARAPVDEETWLNIAEARLVLGGYVSFTEGPARVPVRYPLFGFDRREAPSLYWRDGEVVVSGADEAAIAGLIVIADVLDARVLCDDGKEYA
jgi:hypothetical protein